MNVIFLDMDGVLCTNRSHEAYDGQGLMAHLDPIACKLVERLSNDCNAKIVLSSTWREHFDKRTMTIILQNGGMANVRWHQCWKTPETRGLASRGNEIRDWMQDHGGQLHRYVILDDNQDFLDSQKPFLVLTDTRDGLSWKDYQSAKQILLYGPLVKKEIPSEVPSPSDPIPFSTNVS